MFGHTLHLFFAVSFSSCLSLTNHDHNALMFCPLWPPLAGFQLWRRLALCRLCALWRRNQISQFKLFLKWTIQEEERRRKWGRVAKIVAAYGHLEVLSLSVWLGVLVLKTVIGNFSQIGLKVLLFVKWPIDVFLFGTFALVELLVKQLFTMLYCQKYKICTKFSDMW